MGNKSEERLGTEPLPRLIISLALPSVLAQVVNLLYSIVDRIYIGHMADVGAAALTGLGLCTPIILIVSAFASFAGSGGAPLAAMKLGQGSRDQAERILSASTFLIIFFSAVLTVLLLVFKRPLLFFFGASSDTISYAEQYITIYLCGTIFVQAALGLNNFITCQGKAMAAMISVLIGAVINIVLDPILIFWLDMGITGAAVATVISQMISAIWVVFYLLSKKTVIKIRLEYMRPDIKMIGSIASLGIAPFIMQSTESLIAVVFTSGLQKYGGDMYVGTYTILQSVMQLMTVPMHGVSYGTQPISSYNYGAGNYSRVKKNFVIVTSICLAYTATFYAVVLLFPRTLAGFFTSDTALAELTASKLPVFLVGMVPFAFQTSSQSSLLGIGKAKISLFLASLRKIILLTPLALVLPHIMPTAVDGLYIAEPISDTISAFTALAMFIMVSRKFPEDTHT